jgi:hypothetical protein
MCAPLVGVVTYARRQSLRAEWRAHVELLAAAYEELGSDRRAAVSQALAQFGDPDHLGKLWACAWRPGRRRGDRGPVLPALRAGLGWFGLATVLANVGFILDPSKGGAIPLLGVGMPLLAGLLTGLFTHGRHAMGVFYALALLIPATLMASGTLLLDALDGDAWLVMLQFLVWMPLGCAAATIGGRLREPLKGTIRHWVLE